MENNMENENDIINFNWKYYHESKITLWTNRFSNIPEVKMAEVIRISNTSYLYTIKFYFTNNNGRKIKQKFKGPYNSNKEGIDDCKEIAEIFLIQYLNNK